MVNFKLSLPQNGVTRKVTFKKLPTWDELAAKIETLFSFKSDEVAVSYVDADGDSVTISTNEELREFYAQETKDNGMIKLFVNRLGPPPVPQVPASVDAAGGLGHSPDSDRDWDRMDREPTTPIGTMPLFGEPGVPPMVYAYIPTEPTEIRAASPALSSARIEEVPSTRSQSRGSEVPQPFSNPRFSRAPSRPNLKDATTKGQGAARPRPNNMSRNSTTNVSVDDGKGKKRAPPIVGLGGTIPLNMFGNSHSPTSTERPLPAGLRQGKKPLDSPPSSPEFDPEEIPGPLPQSPPPVTGSAALYNDLAGVMAAMSNIMARAADGVYFGPAMETPFGSAERTQMDNARRALEESSRKVTESVTSVMLQLRGVQVQNRPQPEPQPPMTHADDHDRFGPRPRDAGPMGMGSGIRANPRPWGLFEEMKPREPQPRPAVVSMPPPEPQPHRPRPGQAHDLGARPFIPPFVPQFDAFGRPLPSQTPAPHSVPQPRPGTGMFYPQMNQPPHLMNQPPPIPSQFVPPSGPPPNAPAPIFVPAHDFNDFDGNGPLTGQSQTSERERLESARQLYKMEKANFRAQRELERQERAERKAFRHSKGGPVLDELTQSLEAALTTNPQDEDGGEVPPHPMRPSATPGLFVPPLTGQPAPPAPWDDQVPINISINPEPWGSSSSRIRGSQQDHSDRLLRRLEDMGIRTSTHPQLPSIVKQQARSNLGKPDEEVVQRVIQILEDGPAPPLGPASSRRR